MQFDRLTTKGQQAVQEAQQIAHRHSHQEVDGEHLFAALLGQTDSLIPALLQKMGVSLDKISSDLETELSRRVKVQGTTFSDVFLSSALKKTFNAAESEV